MDNKRPLLEIHDLRVSFLQGKGSLSAVDGISLSINRGSTLGIVGQSGSGKSTLARAVMQLVSHSHGTIRFDGVDLSSLSSKRMRGMRKRMQMVFQDPGGSLNEYMRVGRLVSEPLLVHGVARGKDLETRACLLLKQVGLCADDAKKFPHEFSGGQKQRIAIARAIALKPDFLVCDEPTSALDVSVQAKILNLLADLRDELGLTIMFISHDLSVVHHFCDEVAVMSEGKIVEHGKVEQVIHHPTHEITRQLLASCQPRNISDSPSLIL